MPPLWGACDVGLPPAGHVTFRGVTLESLQPYGGPAGGGPLVTISGRNLHLLHRSLTAAQRTDTPPPLCNFGNATADAAPLGGPARALRAGSGFGLGLPWHVAATIVDHATALCITPPAGGGTVAPTQLLAAPLELSINGQLADLTHSGLSFAYYGSERLNVSRLYPVAGHKEGGTLVTVYGVGFERLGQPGAGLKCLFGGAPPVEAALLHPEGSTAAAEAMDLQPGEPSAALASALTCVAPPYTDEQCDAPRRVCVEVTLNGDRSQNSSSCVQFTYT